MFVAFEVAIDTDGNSKFERSTEPGTSGQHIRHSPTLGGLPTSDVTWWNGLCSRVSLLAAHRQTLVYE